MKKEWLYRILQASIDAGKETNDIPTEQDIANEIYKFVCEHYKKGYTQGVLETLHELLSTVTDAIPLTYNAAKDRNGRISLSALNSLYVNSTNQNSLLNNNINKNNLLTVKDIAEELNITTQTVNGWIRNGRIPATKIGKSYRIKDSDFERFKSERTNLSNIGGNEERIKIISDEYFPVSPITDED